MHFSLEKTRTVLSTAMTYSVEHSRILVADAAVRKTIVGNKVWPKMHRDSAASDTKAHVVHLWISEPEMKYLSLPIYQSSYAQ